MRCYYPPGVPSSIGLQIPPVGICSMECPLLTASHPWPSASGHQEVLLLRATCTLEQRANWSTALIIQLAGLGLFTRWLKILRAVSGQAALCKHFLRAYMTFRTCQSRSMTKSKVSMGGCYQLAGKDLGSIFCNPPQAAQQVSPPAYRGGSTDWHKPPHRASVPSPTSQQAADGSASDLHPQSHVPTPAAMQKRPLGCMHGY